jgi:DNA polymerase IV
MQRVIFHIDMNSYFATCEQQANPHLRGKPVGICEHLGGIIIAASIEAKKLGIKTGTPVWEAKKIYPKIVLMPTDPEKYREITRRFLEIFYTYTEAVEKYSIDEAFLDMSMDFRNEKDPWQKAEEVALEIKRKISKEAGSWIKCSVGIAEDKFLAKIASDLQKPDGLTVVRPEQKAELYDKLSLTDLPGIARRTEKALNLLGIKTLKDLRDYPESKLVSHFGIRGHHLYKMGQLQGSWKEELSGEEEEISKSMGHAYTMPKITADRKIALQVMYKLSEMVGKRLRESNLMGNIVCFVTTDRKGQYFSKRRILPQYVFEGKEIFTEAAALFEKHVPASGQFKLVGVTVSGLAPLVEQQSLFKTEQRKGGLVKSLDEINDKYGDFTISRVPAWQARNIIRDSIGFGRMKEFKVKFKASKR